eukprot:2379817-Karenia_brevis.AAC.1
MGARTVHLQEVLSPLCLATLHFLCGVHSIDVGLPSCRCDTPCSSEATNYQPVSDIYVFMNSGAIQ